MFLNPYSGTKKSRKIWKTLEPYLKVAGVEVDLVETQYAGHAHDYAETMPLEGIDLLVSVSGDGMLHELINGIMSRPDWHRATQIPIATIPAGSGNALASSLMLPTVISAFLSAIKCQWKPLDLMAVYQYKAPERAEDSTDTTNGIDEKPEKPVSDKPAKEQKPPKNKSQDPKEASELEAKPQSSKQDKPAAKQEEQAKSADKDDAPASLKDKKSAPPSGKVDKNQDKEANGTTASPPSSPPGSGKMPNASPGSGKVRKALTEAAVRHAEANSKCDPGTWNLVSYSFLAFMWGLVSDVDIETEPWRWMGEFRFTLGTLVRVAAMRHYPARLLTLETADQDPQRTTCQLGAAACPICDRGSALHHERHQRLEDNFTSTQASSPSLPVEKEEKPSPSEVDSKETSKTSSPQEKSNQETKPDPASSPSPQAGADATAEQEPTKKSHKKRKDASTESSTSQEVSAQATSTEQTEEESKEAPKASEKRSKRKKKTHQDEAVEDVQATPSALDPKAMRGLAPGLESLIPFNPMTITAEQLPEGWREHNSSFVYFVASNMSHLASDLRVAPYAHLSCGSADLVYAESIPKMDFLKLMANSMENGRYIGHDHVICKKVRSFVLIPTGKPGIMDLDGEQYDPLPTAIDVHQGVLRIVVAVWNLTLPDNAEA